MIIDYDFGKRRKVPCFACDERGHCTMNCGPSMKDDKMAKFTIQASTPAEFQTAMVKWLNDQSVMARSQGRISKAKRVQHDRYTEAEALESAARFISEVVIEAPSDGTPV